MSVEKCVFDVDKMKCGGCVATVNSALEKLDGVESFSVSLENKSAEVVSSLSPDIIAAAITAAGFPASVRK